MHKIQCIKYNAYNTMHIIQCTACNAYNTMHRIECTAYKGYHKIQGVRLIVDSTTISNLFYNLQSAPKSTIYNLGKIRLKSTILPKSQKCSLQIYKILARKKYSLQGFFSRIYSLQCTAYNEYNKMHRLQCI